MEGRQSISPALLYWRVIQALLNRSAARERLKMHTHQELPRPKGDRRHLLQPAWGCDATIARFAPEARPAVQRLEAPRASAPNRWPDPPQTDNAPSRRAPGSAHKW